MTRMIADTSGLVGLGVASGKHPSPLECCLDSYEVTVPETVIDELREVASYEDEHGTAAGTVLDRRADLLIRTVDLDTGFPLDDGENAAVTLANETAAALLLCDEFNSLGLVHASLADTRLVTTPTLLSVFVRHGTMRPEHALAVLDEISRVRSWDGNQYVKRARSLLDP